MKEEIIIRETVIAIALKYFTYFRAFFIPEPVSMKTLNHGVRGFFIKERAGGTLLEVICRREQ
jgi:hypothetical protein